MRTLPIAVDATAVLMLAMPPIPGSIHSRDLVLAPRLGIACFRSLPATTLLPQWNPRKRGCRARPREFEPA